MILKTILNKTVMNDKLKFYRETLVQMAKEAYRKMPNELKIEESVVEADLLTKAIMKQIDEFEQEKTNMWSPNYNPSYNMTTTIVDNGPQYQANQKPYGTLDEHWKELIDLFRIKETFGLSGIKDFYREYSLALKTNAIYSPELKNVYEGYRKALFDLMNIANSLGMDFINDFIKACEKCEKE